MSANDILDVLNVQRDDSVQPPKKKKKFNNDIPTPRQSGMARELYNLIGPNTPPVSLSNTSYNSGVKGKLDLKPSPWTRMEFSPGSDNTESPKLKLYHWVKGSKELLEQEAASKPYFFDKFNVNVDIPELVDEELYIKFMEEIKEAESKSTLEQKEKENVEKERREIEKKEREKREEEKKEKEKEEKEENRLKEKAELKESESNKELQDMKQIDSKNEENKIGKETESVVANNAADESDFSEEEWTYAETKYLFELCKAFELKWHIIYDRFSNPSNRTLEDLKYHFYQISAKILKSKANSNPNLVDALSSYSKSKETERKHYLESLLKRTPAEIAEEESLVIEARRFELAAKKMLVERSHLLTLLDSPQTSQSVQQYQSSQGLANLYNNLMIIDKHQKKRQALQHQKSSSNNHDPIPPPIPTAASSSFKKERNFQTPLQQLLSGVLKQNQLSNVKQETSAIQQLLMKRLTLKEEEAYGLHYHSNEKLTAGVVLRSMQKLPGLQQRQSVLKSVSSVLEELDIPTAGGTNWKPVMPTRKTMAKYDDLLKSVVTLLDIKKGKDRLESEIRLIKSQIGLQ